MASTLERAPQTRPAAAQPERAGRRRAAVALVDRTATGATSVRRRAAHGRRALALADALAAAIALAALALLAGGVRPAALVVVALLPLASKLGGLHDRDELVLHKATLDEAPELFVLASVTALAISAGADAFVAGELAGAQIGALWAALFAALGLARWAARALVRALESPERCLCIGDRAAAERLRETLARRHRTKADVVATAPLGHDGLPGVGGFDAVRATVRTHDVQRIVIAPGPHDREEAMLELVRIAKTLGVRVSIVPRVCEVVGSSVRFDQLDGMTLLGVQRLGLTRSAELAKRAVDVLGALVLLLAAAPLLALFALAIKLDSPGPVLFRQTRVGRGDRRFQIFKFRTMVADAERRKHELQARSELDGLFKIARDPRVTRVGRLLRASSLDELPQLLNVLRGEMSLVGPRPLIVDEDCKITGWSRGRLHLKPGMTGHWQVLGSGRIPLAEMVKIDHLYVANWSLWLDLKILARTAIHVLARRGM
ncbi:MAG TPA: exopolysaccharide biosynthesis polyprenyl glycosylphosphotransferase [Conexibacter sp.]